MFTTLFNIYLGPFLDLDSIFFVYKFFHKIGNYSINYFSKTISKLNTDFRFYYLLNNSVVSLNFSSLNFFWGINLRLEAPLLNSRIRKSLFWNSTDLFYGNFSLGFAFNYSTFPVINLGNTLKKFLLYISGKLRACSLFFFNGLINVSFILGFRFFHVLKPFLFIGVRLFSFCSNFHLLLSCFYLKLGIIRDHWVGFNVILNSLTQVGMFELGFQRSSGVFDSDVYFTQQIFYLCGLSQLKLPVGVDKIKSFFIYQGSFFNKHSLICDLLLPTNNIFEKEGVYINILGGVKRMRKSLSSFGSVVNDEDVFNMFTLFLTYRKFYKISNFFLFEMFFFTLVQYNYKIVWNYVSLVSLCNDKKITYFFFCSLNFFLSIKVNNFFLNSTVVNYYRSMHVFLNSINLQMASLNYVKNIKNFKLLC